MTESTEEAREELSGKPSVLGGPADAAHEPDHAHDAYPHLAHHFDSPQQQFDAGKLGIWLFLVTEVLFFAGLFCAYTIYRSQHPEIFYYAHYHLDTTLGAVNTTVLILSSGTAAWAVRCAQLGQKKALITNIVITIACALTFMCVKYVEYSHKWHDGLLWGKRFDPQHEIWELDSFKHKHPEAAKLAEELHAVSAGTAEAPAARSASPAPAPPSEQPAAASSDAGAATDAGNATADAKVQADAGITAEAAAPAAEGTAIPDAGAQAAAPAAAGERLQPTAPRPASQKAAEPPSAAERVRSLIAAAPREALEPLIQAGLIDEQTLVNTKIERPKNVHIFFGIYFFMTGLHGIHVLAGIIVWLWMLVRATKGVFGRDYFGPIDYAALYWHLVDLVWIYLFPLLYLIH